MVVEESGGALSGEGGEERAEEKERWARRRGPRVRGAVEFRVGFIRKSRCNGHGVYFSPKQMLKHASSPGQLRYPEVP